MRSFRRRRPDMSKSRVESLLYDSEAALRLVESEVDRLRASDGAAPAAKPAVIDGTRIVPAAEVAFLPAILSRASDEIQLLLSVLRDSRSAIETATVGRLATTHDKIKQVTDATEVAATDIMDGLDRAQQMIDELDAKEQDFEACREIRNRLRDELFTATTHLQFQDITTQQLNHAAKVLVEMEERLAEVARVIDPGSKAMEVDTRDAPDEHTFDPNATVKNAEERQQLADSVFKGTGSEG